MAKITTIVSSTNSNETLVIQQAFLGAKLLKFHQFILGCQLRGTEDINDGRFFEEPETSTDPFNSGIFAKRTSNKPRPARTCSTHEDLKKLLELYPDERKETEESMRKLLANESCLPACTKFVYEPL